MRSPLALLLLAAAPATAQRLDYEPVSDDRLAEPERLAYQAVDAPDEPADPTAPPAKRGKWLQWGLLDRFEYAAQSGRDGYTWDFSALIGGDRHRLWLGTSGDGPALGGPGICRAERALCLPCRRLMGPQCRAALRRPASADPRLCGARRPI